MNILLFTGSCLFLPHFQRVAHGWTTPATLAPPTTTHRKFAPALFSTPKEVVSSDSGNTTPAVFIRPALHNSSYFRSIAILYALLFAIYNGGATVSPINANSALLQTMGKYLILPPNVAASVHLFAFSTWFGTVIYTTFIAGITMFKNLPRRVFGSVQSKLFPLYFRLCSIMIGIQILTLTAMPDVLSKTSEVSLTVAFVTTLINLLYLEPRSTSVMFDRYALEDVGMRDSEEYRLKAKMFGKLHGISSLANLIALCGGVVHGIRLASGLAV